MTFYVYILRCADGSYYTGHTDNLEVRMAMHIEGFVPCYTKKRRPIELIYSEEFATRDEDFAKKALMKKDFEAFKKLARAHGELVEP